MRTILIVLCMFNLTTLSAQSELKVSGKSVYELRQPLNLDRSFSQLISYQVVTESVELKSFFTNMSAFDWSANYMNQLGFFCKVELKIEHKARVPVKFRLGTVQYTDQLEGKY